MSQADAAAPFVGPPRAVPVNSRDGVAAWALVDDEDHGRLSAFNWSFSTHGYVRRRAAGGGYYPPMHRDVMGLTKGDPLDVDHINHDKLDNRKANLRICTRGQNLQNMRSKGGSSQHRGVSYDPERGKWKAQGSLNYRNYFIGRFDTEEAAARAAAGWRQSNLTHSIEEALA